MRVLLVEDNDDDVLLIQESLSETKISIARTKRHLQSDCAAMAERNRVQRRDISRKRLERENRV